MDIVALYAAQKPGDVALICGDDQLTWADWNSAKNRFAQALVSLGVEAGARVVAYVHNGIESFVISSACERLGLTVVPMNCRLTASEVSFIVQDCGADVVVFEDELGTVADDVRTSVPSVSHWIRVGRGPDGEGTGADAAGTLAFATLIDAASPDAPDALGDGSGSIIYTSGTTGKPKGAYRKPGAGSAGGMAQFIASVMSEMDIRAGDPHLVAGPLYHSAPRAWALIAAALGKTLVIQRRYDPVEAVHLIDRHCVGDTFMAPVLVKRLMRVPDDIWSGTDVSSLHSLVIAGSPCPMSVKEAVHDRLGDVLYEFYGSTELSVCTVLQPADQLRKPGSCGRAFPGVELAVLDADGSPAPDGVPGELHVKRNPMTISEYYRRPGALEASSHGDWISVGDIAYRDEDGYYYICDRKGDMIISGGVNVYPAEVEGVLHAHPAVADVAVFGIPDDEWGESVHAVVELQPDASLTEVELRAWCANQLADFKQPRSLEVVETLPRDAAGKLLKRELRDQYWSERESKVG